jgi:beta-glucosidase
MKTKLVRMGAATGWSLLSSMVLAQSLDGAVSNGSTPRALEPLATQLTLEESIAMLGGTGFATRAVPRLGIPSFNMSDGPSGVRSPGPSTAYAAGIGLAATWDPDLALEVGRQLGRDARARGSRYLLGPGVNIYRAPMNGRNFEYFGEDPWLGSRIAVGYIRGVQEAGVSATVKHFVGNNSEFARHTSDSLIDERALREIYLPIFEAAVKEAHVGAVMSSYNLTNGQHMSQNKFLTRDVLRDQWKFDGVLMSDWGGTYDGVAAALAGQDLEMPTGRFMNRETLLPAVQAGTLSRAAITESVRRQLRLADRFNWSATPAADLTIPRLNPAGRAAAYRGAVEGAVLLKNKNALLPLDLKRIRTIAVIGPTAHPSPSTAGGSGHVPPFEEMSLLEGLSHRLGPDVTLTYAPGLAPPAITNLLTRFTTDASGGASGVAVEVFANSALSGEPQARRVEPQFSNISGGLNETLSLFDWLSGDDATGVIGTLINASPQRTFERWTGWYTPASGGSHTLSIQASASFRLFLDDKLIIDTTRVRRAALLQLRQDLRPGPHKLVFEQSGTRDFGRPTWRLNIVRDGRFVQPLAKELASRADAVIVAVGFDRESEGEGSDREFALPPGQDELIREIAAINPNTVVVVTAGGAVDVRPWLDTVSALMTAWYPGEQGGAALADLLVGQVSPSGRLPISWDRAPEDNPSYQNYYYNEPSRPDSIAYREGIFVGYRGYQKASRKPQFPFGFGLTYTSFTYANLAVTPIPKSESGSAGLYAVSFDVTNAGARAAADVAQIYVGAPRSKVPRPVRELKGFARSELRPGETRHVSIPLDARSFAYYDVRTHSWRADAGNYRIELGRSSDDIAAIANVNLRTPWERHP